MSMGPDPRPGDLERHPRGIWGAVPENLKQKVIKSLDELKNLFPGNNELEAIALIEDVEEDIMIGKGYKLYGQKTKGTDFVHPIAYECKNCENIITGPPEIKDFETPLLNPCSMPTKGYSAHCIKCHEPLYSESKTKLNR